MSEALEQVAAGLKPAHPERLEADPKSAFREQALAAIPLALALALIATYGLFFYLYIECRWKSEGCRRINVSDIYLPDTAIINNYPEVKAISIKETETALQAATAEAKEVAAQNAEKLRQREELQRRALDVSAKASSLAALQTSGQETDEYRRVKDVYERIEKEKEETAALLALLKERTERVNAQVQSLSARLGTAHKRVVVGHNSRLIWVLFTGLFVVTILGAFYVALSIPYRTSRENRYVVIVLALLYIVYAVLRERFDAGYKTVFEEIVERLFTQGPPAYYGLFDLLGNTAALALVVTPVFILWHPKSFFREEAEQFEDKLAELSTRKKYLRVVLYVGTTLLVVGILRMRVLLDWLQSSILQPELGQSVDEFGKVFITFQGVLYTLLLAAVYLPARQLITERARSLPFRGKEKQDERSEKQSQLTANGFGSSETIPYKDYLPKLLALLAPMLVGPVAEMVQKIFE